jgi:glycosyltransferase involved in cell wall biosynthesis
MRILLVVYGGLEQLSGGYLYDRRVVGYMRERGVTVEVLGLAARPYLLCPLHAFHPALRRLFGGRPGRGEPDYDAVVADELAHPSLALPAGARARRVRAGVVAGRPLLVTLVHHLRCREDQAPLAKALARSMERRLLGASNAVIASSRATAASVEELLGRPARIAVCPPGCDELALGPRPPEPGAGRAEQPLGLLCTGNLIPRKGQDLLLRALAELAGLPWRLRLVGRPVDRRYARRLRSMARAAGLEGRVTFTGVLAADALAEEYRRADVFVFPSRYEGYGIALAEAIRAGLPFAAFAGGGVSEVVHGRGLLAPPGDLVAFRENLRRLIADSELRERMAALSRELAAGLPAWEDTGRGFLQALEVAVFRG